MKTIKYLFYIILLLSNIGVQGSYYSINILLDYLQETQYYDLIQKLKIAFGNDVAIDVCKELAKNNDCGEVVRIYMVNEPEPYEIESDEDGSGVWIHHAPPIYILNVTEILNYFEEYCKIKKGTEKRKLIELMLRYYATLIQQMKDDKEIISFIKNIIKMKCIRKDLIIVQEPIDKKS